VTRFVPPFDFFRAPSRYGLGATFAAAVLSGAALQSLLNGRRRSAQWAIAGAVFLATAADLLESDLARVLRRENERAPVRVLTSMTSVPAENVPSVYGVSTLPPSLALPPRPYAESRRFQRLARQPRPNEPLADDDVEWLRDSGATHILTAQPLDSAAAVDLAWKGRDELLEREWQRGFSGPIHLYRLRDAPGRARFAEPQSQGTARVVSSAPPIPPGAAGSCSPTSRIPAG
jgi:hypothetical protein